MIKPRSSAASTASTKKSRKPNVSACRLPRLIHVGRHVKFHGLLNQRTLTDDQTCFCQKVVDILAFGQ